MTPCDPHPTATSDLNMRPVELGKGGAYSEILRMLLDAGASPFVQRIPALHPPEYDGNVPEISGNVGFTALHYAVQSMAKVVVPRHIAAGSAGHTPSALESPLCLYGGPL